MSETITFHALDLAGETGLKLYLRKNDGSLLNTGGDAFTDLGSAGVFTATLAESRVGLGTLHARVCDGTETADNSVFEEFLPESETVIGATGGAVLNTAEREAIVSIIYDTLTTHPVLEDSYGELFQNIAAIGSATQTKASNILDGVGWLLADATGAIAAPQSATATAILTTFGSTYTVQYAGLTSTGVRTAPTLSKA